MYQRREGGEGIGWMAPFPTLNLLEGQRHRSSSQHIMKETMIHK